MENNIQDTVSLAVVTIAITEVNAIDFSDKSDGFLSHSNEL